MYDILHFVLKLPHFVFSRSHGKEKLGGKPDTAKGSFYFNPLVDCPGSESDRTQYPASYPCNLWPSEAVLPGFRDAATDIGKLMFHVVTLLAKHIDHFVYGASTSYPPNMLRNILSDSEKVKGRLLYYYPLKKGNEYADDVGEDSWIGWHNDSGFLTALAGEIYVNDTTGKILEDCPDPQAGLYVSNRMGETCKVCIPFDCMAVQLGECIQILTGGLLAATPHCVRGVTTAAYRESIARISLPCFIDSVPSFKLVCPSSREIVLHSGVRNEKVPHLSERWTENGMTFGDFLQKSFEIYYNWSLSSVAENDKSLD